MKKTIYLGMNNVPHEVYETAYVKNFKVVYQHENNNGKHIMLKATQDNGAYYPEGAPRGYLRYPNRALPVCKAGKLYPIDILNQGYSSHYFELVEV